MKLRTLLLAGVLATALPALCGCGFAPMYAQTGLTQNLSAIAVDVPQTRTGYFLEQSLRSGFGNDAGGPKLYTLKVDLKENHYSIGYRVDDTSTRSEISNVVTYTLTDNATGKALLTKVFVDTITYDTSTSPLTGVVLQQEGQQRSAASISQKIQGELALYFHDKH